MKNLSSLSLRFNQMFGQFPVFSGEDGWGGNLDLLEVCHADWLVIDHGPNTEHRSANAWGNSQWII